MAHRALDRAILAHRWYSMACLPRHAHSLSHPTVALCNAQNAMVIDICCRVQRSERNALEHRRTRTQVRRAWPRACACVARWARPQTPRAGARLKYKHPPKYEIPKPHFLVHCPSYGASSNPARSAVLLVRSFRPSPPEHQPRGGHFLCATCLKQDDHLF